MYFAVQFHIRPWPYHLVTTFCKFYFVIIQSLGTKKINIQWAQHASQQFPWGVYFPKWGHLGGGLYCPAILAPQ